MSKKDRHHTTPSSFLSDDSLDWAPCPMARITRQACRKRIEHCLGLVRQSGPGYYSPNSTHGVSIAVIGCRNCPEFDRIAQEVREEKEKIKAAKKLARVVRSALMRAAQDEQFNIHEQIPDTEQEDTEESIPTDILDLTSAPTIDDLAESIIRMELSTDTEMLSVQILD